MKQLEANGFQGLIAKNGEEASGSSTGADGLEIFLGASVRLKPGITEVWIMGTFRCLYCDYSPMNRETQGRETRKPAETPISWSVHAATEDSHATIALKTAVSSAHMPPAPRLVVVLNKIVEGPGRRVQAHRGHCVPLGGKHMQKLYKTGTEMNRC